MIRAKFEEVNGRSSRSASSELMRNDGYEQFQRLNHASHMPEASAEEEAPCCSVVSERLTVTKSTPVDCRKWR